MTTLYMVELDFPFPDERAGFDQFYDKHITMLLSIPGFRSAQRFEAIHPAHAPFMAVYELDGPEVMSSEAYTSRAGPSSVSETYRPKMLNWKRNLVVGPRLAMDVGEGSFLHVIDRITDDGPALPGDHFAFEPVGLDRSIAGRALAVDAGAGPALPGQRDGWVVRRMRPLHPRRLPR